MYRIHRELLRKYLGLPNKLPKSLSLCYPDALVPVGYSYAKGPAEAPNRRVDLDNGYSIVAGTQMTVTVVVVPTPDVKRKSSAHRIHIVCPDCERLIPAGRYHQHVGTGGCKL